ncbi:MAG: cupin-like domain-containing protein [Porticoccaceae bacterium]|nr:cupin-like domain-containing protein [Porticoccaceae bacterium]
MAACQPDNIPDKVLNSAQPLILRGLVEQWPMVQAAKASAQQAVEYLGQFSSEEPLTVYRGGPEIEGRVFYNADLSGFNFDVARLPLAEVVSELMQNIDQPQAPMLYVGSTMIDKWLPGFRAENNIALDEHDPLVSIWLGNQSRIAAHYDFASNIACCVAGRRRFTLFPPEQLDNLYVGPLDFTPAGQPISMVDFANPDFERFPKFREALKHAQVVELEPGDALLIPSMWWHHVESLEGFNVLVNYWWRNSPSFMGAPLNVLQHAMMGLRDLPPEQRAVWQHIFEHYVFDPKDENFEHIPERSRGVLNAMTKDSTNGIRSLLLNRLKR